MSQPVWEKITQNGKPFGYKTEEETSLLEEVNKLSLHIEDLKGYIEKLEKENSILKESLNKIENASDIENAKEIKKLGRPKRIIENIE